MMTTPKSVSAPLPIRGPTPLSAAQEGQVRELYYARVRRKCADEIREFAACATNRTFSATWVCRQQRLAMNSCMVAHASQKEQDAAREEWFATMDDRRKAREEKGKKKAEAEKFYREWWDLDKKSGQDPKSET
ncbi:hypothetical protein ABVK25_005333 [Lepraria finkii]|uniref:COX assembly mitochondrial protein n=1 Tax=Lepraria finkii TaxID=1340010 RepID=A0ABR4B8M5_9LECA